MEILGINRNGVEEFVVRCEIHDYYYNGRPPIVAGCTECWNTYFFAQIALSGGDMKTHVAQLESAVRHAAELEDKGKWDFKPEYSMTIDKEPN